jgi:hypothetical protein
MGSEDRRTVRQFFLHCWRMQQQGGPLEPLERLVAEVINQHPEYHPLLERGEAGIEQDFPPDQGLANPFLHMGMHISLREQLLSDRPQGIRDLYHRLMAQQDRDAHRTEHFMMDCLGHSLWEGQRNQQPPDEQRYLHCLRQLLQH